MTAVTFVTLSATGTHVTRFSNQMAHRAHCARATHVPGGHAAATAGSIRPSSRDSLSHALYLSVMLTGVGKSALGSPKSSSRGAEMADGTSLSTVVPNLQTGASARKRFSIAQSDAYCPCRNRWTTCNSRYGARARMCSTTALEPRRCPHQEHSHNVSRPPTCSAAALRRGVAAMVPCAAGKRGRARSPTANQPNLQQTYLKRTFMGGCAASM